MAKQSPKNVVLPHSEAKLEMYQRYLSKYIQILVAYQGFNQVNLYDVFCGSGIYEDGKSGSPVLAFEAIRQNREWCLKNNKTPTRICLTVNDLDKNKVLGVKQHLASFPSPVDASIIFESLSAEDFLTQILNQLNRKGQGERNLVFIDPYGYKEIKAQTLSNLLASRTTEVILFLPISFIYRFAGVAQTEIDVVQYEHLRTFISTFFPANHPITRNEVRSPIEFVQNLKDALSFGGQHHTACYYIQRDKGNYFALFFMTSNLLGLEKFLETKWELDPVRGQGYKMPDPLGPGLFDTQFGEEERDDRLQKFGKELDTFLRKAVRSDKSVYEFTLLNECLPAHTVSIFKEWQKNGSLESYGADNKLARKGSFNINYDSTKPAGSKFTFKLK